MSSRRNLPGRDPQRQALGDRRLADAGFTDQDRVVLAAAAENLDDLLDLRIAADHWVDAPVARVSGEVVAELIQRSCLRTSRGDLGAPAPHLRSGSAGRERASLCGAHRLAGALVADSAVVRNTGGDEAELCHRRPFTADVAEALVFRVVFVKIHYQSPLKI